MAEQESQWTPYPHEAVRVSLLWRKRILLGLLIGALFLFWALSLGVATDTEEEIDVLNDDGDKVSVQRPDQDERERPVASVTLRPGETARLDNDLTLGDDGPQRQPGGAPVPDRPEGVPFMGLLLLIGPFLLAVLAWRYLSLQGASTEVNYGIYKGSMPLELVTATHAPQVQTGQEVPANPFGKARGDYLRDALNDPAREHGPRFGARARAGTR